MVRRWRCGRWSGSINQRYSRIIVSRFTERNLRLDSVRGNDEGFSHFNDSLLFLQLEKITVVDNAEGDDDDSEQNNQNDNDDGED